MTAEVLLDAQQLTVGHQGRALLPPLDLRVEPRQCWALIGPNGAGKTTLVRTLLGLLPAVAGRVERQGSLAYVPQRTELDPAVPARVVDLVRLGTERRWSFLDPRHQARCRPAVERAMADTEVASLQRHPIQHLSEGQKQRVLMAQALAGDPRLLVLDEPTSAMDLHAERGIFRLIDRLRDSRGLAVVVVGHNLGLLARFATHALFVDKDQAVVRAGPIQAVIRTPEFRDRYGLLNGGGHG